MSIVERCFVAFMAVAALGSQAVSIHALAKNYETQAPAIAARAKETSLIPDRALRDDEIKKIPSASISQPRENSSEGRNSRPSPVKKVQGAPDFKI